MKTTLFWTLFLIDSSSGFMPALLAQQQQALVQGTVEDETGAKVAKAAVKLFSEAGETLNAVTDEIGHFEFTGVGPGKYLLQVKFQGFASVESELSVGASATVAQRIQLKLADASEEITVSARRESDPLDADQNATSIVLDHDLLKDLPTKNDDPLAVTNLFVDPAANDSQRDPKIYVDGVEGDTMDVPRGSVKSIMVDTSPYSTKFGRPGKGRIEITTRAGSTRRYHRRLGYNIRDAAMDARNHFDSSSSPRRRQWLEGAVDGPLVGDTSTFFVGGDFLRDNDNAYVKALTKSGPESATVLIPRRTVHLFGRTDTRVTPLNILSVRYNWGWDNWKNQGVGGFNLPERGWASEKRIQELRIAETSTPTPNFLNQFVLYAGLRNKTYSSVSNAPAVIVNGAFNSGGAQISRKDVEKDVEFQESATYFRGLHSFLFGGVLKSRFLDYTDGSNFGGTFQFSDLTSFVNAKPFLYTMNLGDPRVTFRQHEISYYLQDEMRLLPHLRLLVGLRHELQSNLSYHKSLAPRVALAASTADGRLVVRAGAGIFYQRQPVTMEEQFLLLNGTHERSAVLSQPGFPSPGNIPNTVPDSVLRMDPHIRSPYAIQASLGAERKLGQEVFITADYTMLLGRRLYGTRDINAPVATGLRPEPNFVNIGQFETSGSSESHNVTLGFRTTLRRLQLITRYTLSHSIDNTSGMSFLPADNFNRQGERGRSDFDQRHRLNIAGVLKLPYHFNLGLISTFRSGIPYNITSGFDTNNDTVANDRPSMGNVFAPFNSFGVDGSFISGTKGVLYSGPQALFGGTLVPVNANNVHWLILPGVGNVGRNVGIGPRMADIDLRLSKKLVLKKAENKTDTTREVEFRSDVFDILNKTNYRNYVGTLTSPVFGQPIAAYPSREVQLSIRFSF